MPEATDADSKLAKITDILQKYWFFIFYLVLLPLSISGITSYVIFNFVPGDPEIVAEIGFSSLFLLLLPLVLIFFMPFDKYREKRLFISTKYPTKKHILFYYSGPLLASGYTLLLEGIFDSLGYQFNLFFGEQSLFLRILAPMLTFVFLIFYNRTRKVSKENASLEEIENKSKEETLVTVSLIIETFYIIWFGQTTIIPIIAVNLCTSIIFIVLFNSFFVAEGEDETDVEQNEQNKITFKELPFKIKSRVFFNIFPAIQTIVSSFLFFWNYGLVDLNLSILISAPMIGFSFILKTIFFIYYYQLSGTHYQQAVTESKKTHIVNAMATVISSAAAVVILSLDLVNLFNQIIALVFICVLLTLTVIEGDRDLLSKKAYSAFSVLFSIALLTLIGVLLPFELIFKIIVVSILLYADLEFLSRKDIIIREKTVVFQGFLLATIILELFYSVAEIVLSRFLPLGNPTEDMIFIASSITFAFCAATICLLIWFYFSKLKRRTSKTLKISLLILHILVTVSMVLLSALDILDTWDDVSNEFFIITRFMIPIFLSLVIHNLIFGFYGRVRIYERRQIVNIEVILLDLVFLVFGLSIFTLLTGVVGFLILALLEFLSLILHAVIKHNNHLIKDEKYNKIINFIATVVLFDIVALTVIVFVDVLQIEPVLSLILTSILTVIIIQIFNAIKTVFTRRFILVSNVVTFSIDVVLIPLYVYSHSIDWLGFSPSDILYWVNSISALFLFFACGLILWKYILSNGLIYGKKSIILTNLAFFGFYITASMLPIYIMVLFQSLGILVITEPLMMDLMLPISLIIFNVLIYIDVKIVEGLYNKPKVWIANAVKKDYIKIIVAEDPLVYNKKLFESLKLDKDYSKKQEEDEESGNDGDEDEDNELDGTQNGESLDELQDTSSESSNSTEDETTANQGSNIPIQQNLSFIIDVEDPKDLAFQKHAFYQIVCQIGWIASILMGVFVSILINQYILALNWKLVLITLINTGALLNMINHMLRGKVISDKIFRRLLVTDYIVFIVIFVYAVFSLVQLLIPIDFDIVFGYMLSIEAAICCLFIIFYIIKRPLLRYSPKFYFYGCVVIDVVIAAVSAILVFMLLDLPSFGPSSFYTVLVQNPVFIITLISYVFFILITPIFRFLKGYNRHILKTVSFTYEFPAEVLQDQYMVEEMKKVAEKGISSDLAEKTLKNFFNITTLSKKRKTHQLIIYLSSALFISEILIILGIWNPNLSIFNMILEGSLAAFIIFYGLIYLDKKYLNHIPLQIQNKLLLLSWIGVKILGSIYAASLLEDAILSVFLLTAVFITFFTQITNYYLNLNELKSEKWKKYGDLTIQIILVCLSSFYFLDLSISTFLTYKDIQIIGSTLQTAFIYQILPFLCLFVHISFYITYLGKKPRPVRFSRTFVFSFVALAVGVSLIPFTDNLIDLFITNGYPVNISLFEESQAALIFAKNIGLDALIILTIGFAVNYYYMVIPKQNVIVNFLHRLLCFLIGFLVFNSLILDLFSILIGGTFAPASPSLFGSSGSLGIMNYLWLERVVISYGISAIINYYLQKKLKFEIYKGFFSQIQDKQLELGFSTGLNRSLGIGAMTFGFLNIIRTITGVSLGAFGASTNFSLEAIQSFDLAFIVSLAVFTAALSFYYYVRAFLKAKEALAFNLMFSLKVIIVLSLSTVLGIIIFLYQNTFRYVTPFILIYPYWYLARWQRKNPERAGITIGIAKGLLFFIFIFWILHFYLFGVAIINLKILNPSNVVLAEALRWQVEIPLTIGIVGFIWSRSIKNLPQKVRKAVIPSILVSAVALISYGFYQLISSVHIFVYNSPIFIDNQLAILLAIDMGIFLFYFAIGLYKWTLNTKEIWSAGWWLWTIFPIVNFNVLMKILSDLDVITESLNILGLFEIDGSLIVSLVIASVLYFPIILYKLKNIFKYAFFVIWFESLGLWIWLSQNLYASSSLSRFLTPLFIFGFTILSLVPLFYKLKKWKTIAVIWILMAFANSILFSVSVYVSVIPDIILDISIYLFICGVFLMLFSVNPAIKEQWMHYGRVLITGFSMTVFGLAFILFTIFYTVTSDIIFALNLSSILIGLLLLSGKSNKLQIFGKKINWIVLIIVAVNSGLMIYRALLLNGIFLISIANINPYLDLILQLSPFAFGMGLSFAAGIVLFSQYRDYISRENWRLVFLIFALSLSIAISTIIEAVGLFDLNYYAAINIGLFIVLAYPSLKLYKVSFWFLSSVGLAFASVPVVLTGFDFAFDGYLTRVYGLYGIIWIIDYLLISLVVLFAGYKRYGTVKKEDRLKLRDLGLIDLNDSLLYEEKDIDDFSPEKRDWLREIYEQVHSKPKFFESKENYSRYVAFDLVFLCYALGLFTAQIVTLDLVYQLPVFVLFVAIGNFIALTYSKNRSLIENKDLVDLIELVSTTLLYFSLGYLCSIFINGLILLAADTLGATLTLSQEFTGLLSSIMLGYYIIILIIDGNLKLYSRQIRAVLKVVLWTLFVIPIGIFVYLVLPNLLVLFAVISLSLFNLSYHLKQFLDVYAEGIEVLDEAEQQMLNIPEVSGSVPAGIEFGADGTTNQQAEGTLGLDQPAEIMPPEEISDADIFAQVDFSDLEESIDTLFEDESGEGGAEMEAATEVTITQSEASEEQATATELSPQEIAALKLEMIKKRQQIATQMRRFIQNLDMFIKQSFVFELSYALMLVLLALLPKNEQFEAPFDYIFILFFFTLLLSVFYNHVKIVKKGLRVRIAVVIMILLLLSTIAMPFALYSVYGTELGLIGNGVFAPIGTPYLPNILFLAALTLFGSLWELLNIIKNHAETKNVNLRNALVDKWGAVIQPIMLILLAYIIANLFSYTGPFITRFTIASFILLGELLLDHYLLKLYKPFNRARYLLYSWTLCNVMLGAQLISIAFTYPRPLSLALGTALIMVFMQFITVKFVNTYQNAKLVRQYNIPEEKLSKLKEGDNIALMEDNELKIISSNDLDNLEDDEKETSGPSQSEEVMDQFDKETILKYRKFSEYRRKKYEVIAIVAYILTGLFASAEVLENLLIDNIIMLYNEMLSNSLDLLTATGSLFVINVLMLFIIAAVVSFVLGYQDRYTSKFIGGLTRDVYLLTHWLSLSVLLGLLALFMNNYYGQQVDLVSPIIFFLLSLLQYYTMYLIGNIVLHSSSKYKVNLLFSDKIQQFPEEYKETIVEIMGYIPDWEYLDESKKNKQKRTFLLELMAELEPKRIKVAQIINASLGVIVYFFIGYSAFLFFDTLTGSWGFSIVMGLAIIYAQSELNYYKIKTFSEKYNYLFTLVTWVLFAVAVSVIPLIAWNQGYATDDLGFWIDPIPFSLSNFWLISVSLVIFNVTMFYSARIVRRYYTGLDVKLKWYKYLRIFLYLNLSLSLFALLCPSSLLFAIVLSSLFNYIAFYSEQKRPVLIKKKVLQAIQGVSGLVLAISSGIWVFQYVSIEILVESVAFFAALLVITVLFPLIYNPFKREKYKKAIYWLVLAIEIGFLIGSISTIPPFVGAISSVVFALMYILIFEFRRLINLFVYIFEAIKNFLLGIVEFFKTAWQRIVKFFKEHKDVIWFILAVIGGIVVYIFIEGLFVRVVQSVSISALASVVLLYPLFNREKDENKNEKTFSRQLYYAIMVYAAANFSLFSFVPINIIWLLLSAVILSTITSVVIYRRETMYNLSVKWRFTALIVTIGLAAALITIIVLFALGKIAINF